ncbi:TPA: hypothetical protein K8N61_003063 [Clostridium perfringens]|nr:hypothetical protein [Clostridium perfringens]HBI6922970.1 hypothetical protein [Clostridium perfringens]
MNSKIYLENLEREDIEQLYISLYSSLGYKYKKLDEEEGRVKNIIVKPNKVMFECLKNDFSIMHLIGDVKDYDFLVNLTRSIEDYLKIDRVQKIDILPKEYFYNLLY